MQKDILSELMTLISVLFSVIFAFFLFFFGGFSLLLVLKGQTQLEYHNPGSRRKHLRHSSGNKSARCFGLLEPSVKRNFDLFFMTGNRWWTFWIPSTKTPTWSDWEKQINVDNKDSETNTIESDPVSV